MVSLARESDRAALEAIWMACFGGPQEYLDFYFEKRFRPEETLVWRERDIPVSMMTMMDVTMEGQPGSYIYAVATLPEFRHQGFMRKLDNAAKRILTDRGRKFTVLIPAELPLFAMYEKLGYHAEFFLWEGEAQATGNPGIAVSACNFGEFSRMRGAYLSEMENAVFHPEWELRYIYEELRHFSGGVLLLNGKGRKEYAAYSQLEDETVLIREYSGSSPLEAAAAVLSYLEKQRARIRSPQPFPGAKRIPYGMGRSLIYPDAPLAHDFQPPFYMSLMLD